jgi:hypothetical protein
VGTSKNAISTAFSEYRFVAAKGLAAFYEKYKLRESRLPHRLFRWAASIHRGMKPNAAGLKPVLLTPCGLL